MFDDFLKADFQAECVAGAGLLLILTAVNLGAGFAQSKQGRGTTWRWLWVSGAVALLQISPLLMFWVLWTFLVDVGAAGEHDLSVYSQSVDGALAVMLLYYTVFQSIRFLRSPGGLFRRKDELPLVTDAEVQRDVIQLSQALRIMPPVAREFKTPAGGLAVLAAVGGLSAPSIVVTDGVLLRLLPAERRAIIAHELAHLANHSLWFFLATSSVAGGVMMANAIFFQLSWPVVLLSLLVLHMGLYRITSRYFEYDCDRRAAQLIGFRVTASALQKVHIAHVVDNVGWRSQLFYAVATHPSLDERIAALRKRAPADDQPEISGSETIAARRHAASLWAGAIWLGALVFALLFAPHSKSSLVLMGAILCCPIIFQGLAIRSEYKIDARRRYPSAIRPSLKWGLLLIAVMITVILLAAAVNESFRGDWEKTYAILFALFWIVGFFTFCLVRIRNAVQPGHPFLEQAIGQGKWSETVNFARNSSKKVQFHPRNRLLISLAKWQLGDQETAVSELQSLWKSTPSYRQPPVTLALMSIESGQFQQAIDLCREVQPKLKNDIVPHFIAARAARFLGNADQQMQSLTAIRSISPTSPLGTAVQMMLELDAGDLAAARLSGERLAVEMPGDPFALLLQAELEWKDGNPEAAHRIADQFQSLQAATPLLFLGAEWTSLNQLLVRSGSFESPNDSIVHEPVGETSSVAMSLSEEDLSTGS